jgi:hypothetical protein
VSSEIVKKNQGVAFWEISGGIRSS